MQPPMLLYDMDGVHVSRQECVLLISAVARARVPSLACLCARANVFVCVPLGLSVCSCMQSVCERTVRSCASRLHVPCHRTAPTCGINSSARVALCGHACVVAFGATGRARARLPQVSRGRSARPTRHGLRDMRTRP
jgi:hypothetical protein